MLSSFLCRFPFYAVIIFISFSFLYVLYVVFIFRSTSFLGRLPNLVNEQTKFAFYGIKIRVETPEIKILSVALLSQAKNLSVAWLS